jgi:hypothetical protein
MPGRAVPILCPEGLGWGGTLPGAHLAGECHPLRCGTCRAAHGPNYEIKSRPEMFQPLRLRSSGKMPRAGNFFAD